MGDNIETAEQGRIIVKQEHAYATEETSNNLQSYNSLDEDPLKIFPFEEVKIKTEDDIENLENVEIKMEVEDDEFIDTSRSDLELPDWDNDVNSMNTMENRALDENSLNGEFVPRSMFVDLENKYKRIFQQRNVLVSKNKSLKNEITKLRKELWKESSVSFRQLQNDLKATQILGDNLKYEINHLTKQNIILKKRLRECSKLLEYEDAMKASILQVKERVENFTNKEKVTNDDLNNLRSLLKFKDDEQRQIEKRLHLIVIKMKTLKNEILDNSKDKKLYSESQKEKERIRKELNDCLKVRYLYEDHAESIKKEMSTKLKEKEDEIMKLSRALDRVSKVCKEEENSNKILKEKLNQFQKKHVKETERIYFTEKQKSTTLQEKMLEKHNENISLKKENAELKKKLGRNMEELIQKNRENVTLREEIAMLRVELEKLGARTSQFLYAEPY